MNIALRLIKNLTLAQSKAKMAYEKLNTSSITCEKGRGKQLTVSTLNSQLSK